MSAGGTRAIDATRAAGIEFRVHRYDQASAGSADDRGRDRRPAYGLEAAAALGVDPGRVFKTLVASVDERLVVAVVPVAGELDLRALAAAAGGRRAAMAEPAAAERATGYVVGGISPLGLRRPLPAFLDASADAWPTVFVSAGKRGVQVELAPGDLARLAGAKLAAIARPA